MGVDFLERTKKTIRVGWDRSRVRLATADLLTRMPERTACSVAFDVIGESVVHEGENLTVDVQESTLIARRGLTVVARRTDPPPAVLQAIKESSCQADATVGRVHPISRVLELDLC